MLHHQNKNIRNLKYKNQNTLSIKACTLEKKSIKQLKLLQLTMVAVLLIFSLFFNAGCTKGSDKTDATVHGYVAANIKGLDPVHANDLYSNMVIQLMNDTLLGYDYLARPVKVIPLLAAEMPTVSKDGLTHTFKISTNARFHDDPVFKDGVGRAVTSEDFIYAWRRLADTTVNSDGFWIFDGRIVGLNEWREKKAKGTADYSTPIEGLQAPDSQTLVIKLTKPFFQLHYVLTMNYTAPVPKEAVEKYGPEFINHPVGTGPFQLKTWIRGTQVEMVRNKKYKGPTYPTTASAEDKALGLLDDAGKELPLADRIVMYEIVEDQSQWLKFLNGEIDFSSIPKDNFDTAVVDGKLSKEMTDKGIRLGIESEPDVTYFAFNMKDPILGKNKNLRLAVAHSIDFNLLIKNFYNNRAIRAQSPIPPGMDGYEESFKNQNTDFDISKAKQYLKEAGFPEGKGLPELEYSVASGGTLRQIGEYVQQSLAKIGIKMKIVTTTWPQLTQKINERKAQIWGIAWGADYPDAENFLQLLFGPNQAPGSNGANFQNAKYDELYKKSALLPPGKERTELYKQMRNIFAEEMPWVPGVHRTQYTLNHPWLKNLKRHPIQAYNLRFVRVDAEARALKKK
jgi:oligopeptide transport system substrate-binding protein